MPWGAAIAAAATIGSGMLASKSEKKKSKAAMAQEDKWRGKEFGLAQEQFDWSKDIYNEHKAKFDPLFNEMRGMMDDTDPDYGAIAGDVNSSFDSARGMERRDERRYGIRPSDGAARHSQREYGIKRGAAHVGARSAARAGAKEMKYARRADLFNSGQGIGSDNASRVTQSMTNQQIAAGNAASAYGQRSGIHDRNAAADAAGWGQAIGSVDWGKMWSGIQGWGSGSGGGANNTSMPGGYTDSDARLKENITPIGSVQGINLYSWDWNELAQERGVDGPTVGVLAQEHLESGCVIESDGFLKVNYEHLFAQANVGG